MPDIVQKLWGFCHTLRHDGIGYSDYVEQITYLLFLKMADEKSLELPKGADWKTLTAKVGEESLDAYVDALRALGKAPGLVGKIFAGAQCRFTKPVNLKKVLALIDDPEIRWTELDVDVKAEAYEGLLEKAASEGKRGAGQYFTPRPLIRSIVRCLKPDPRPARDFSVCDPACGVGGFLVAAYDWFRKATGGAMDRELAKRVRGRTYFGQELVEQPRRLALMNLHLHGLDTEIRTGDSIYDAPDGATFSVVLTNPPFGTKGANQAPNRDDFTVATSNKQLNFVQHVMTILKAGGRAGVVLPDNCLFADQAAEVMKLLTEDCDLHTVLRLPRGTFTPYCQGVKANVVFFTKGTPTEKVWIYDNRTNIPGITKKDRRLADAHFADFERCYGPHPDGRSPRKAESSPDDRWRSFHISEVKEKGFKLDGFKWLKEDSLEDADDLPEPEELAVEAIAELRGALAGLDKVLALLSDAGGNGKGNVPARRGRA